VSPERTKIELKNMPPPHRTVQAHVLRSVASPKVCAELGGVLRSGSSGSEQTYDLSTPCEEIDVFLSHSWRDSGFLKYLAMCMHFNAHMALAASTASSLVCFVLCRSYDLRLPFFPVVPFMSLFVDLMDGARAAGFELTHLDPKRFVWLDPAWKPLYAPVCQIAALLTFVPVLLFGHHIRKPVTMFLDKVCIHQTDPVRKAEGIQAIDQFLMRSKTMIICYNDDYFERLWCATAPHTGAPALGGTPRI
jgi:hypothetical protein